MPSDVRDFVLAQPLFDNHDHHGSFVDFERERARYDALSLLGYADADIVTAAGARRDKKLTGPELVAANWANVRTTGYGRATAVLCNTLFGLEYTPANFEAITEKLQASSPNQLRRRSLRP